MKFRTSLIGRTEAERDALRAKIEAMEKQEPVAFALYSGWARKAVYLSEIEACEQRDRRQLTADLGGSLEAYRVVPLYRAPGAQPAPSVPREAIDKMLTQLMDIAVSNGANSISMPDEYVEVAAWLCGIPAQPAPSFADAYQGAMEEVAIWKKRALEAEDLNRKFIAEINGPTHMGEPTQHAAMEPTMQDALMKFDPATGEEMPYPSHATQWRNWHGIAAWLFDPWTGRRRNAHDVGSDVHGLLIVPTGTLGMDMGSGCAEAKT